ncbi:hypothetical protein D918_00566 [Trichuris suis]|nr:hypothetical protein D918_00566 [Trichuris suis]
MMAEQLVLEEPSSKKLKIGSPSLATPGSSSDFNFDWNNIAVDLPDELLDPSTSAMNDSPQVHPKSVEMPPMVSSNSNSVQNGPSLCNGPSSVQSSAADATSESFNSLASTDPSLSETTTSCSAAFVPNGMSMPASGSTASNSGSVLEELLLRVSSASGNSPSNVVSVPAGNGSGAHQPLMSSVNQSGSGASYCGMRSPSNGHVNPMGSSPNMTPIRQQAPPSFASDQAHSTGFNNGSYMGQSAGALPPQYSVAMGGGPHRMPGGIPSNRMTGMINGHQVSHQSPSAPASSTGVRMAKGGGSYPPPLGTMVSNMMQMSGPPHMQQVTNSSPQVVLPQQNNQGTVRMAPGQMGHMQSGHYQEQQAHYVASQVVNTGRAPQSAPDYVLSQQTPNNAAMSPYGSNMPPSYVPQRAQFSSHASSNPSLSMTDVALTTVVSSSGQNQQQPPPPPQQIMVCSSQAGVQVQSSSSQSVVMQSMGPPGGPAAAQDPEKRKLIQQQLVLLLHAHKCQQRERELHNGQRSQCTLPHCQTMKNVLNHMTLCTEGRSCQVPHCASSRQIIAHWKNCLRVDCPVCLPLKQMTDKRQVGSSGHPAGVPMLPSDGAGQGRVQQNGPPHMGAQFSANNYMSVGQRDAFADPSVAKVSPSYRFVNPGGGGPSSSQTSPWFPGFPPLESASVPKEWHKQVTSDLRQHLVSKLVKAIFPSPDPAAIHDQRIKDLINYARKVEKEMFELAGDREEYYHLLAEKIYKIQKELQEKKQKRLELAKTQGAATPSPTHSTAQSSTSGTPLSQMDATVPPNRTAPMSMQYSNSAGSGDGGQAPPYAPSSVETKMKVEVQKAEGNSTYTVKNESQVSVKSETADGHRTVETNTPKDSFPITIRKVFTCDELLQNLLPVWERLERMEEAIPFRVPVDPQLLNIPDYFDIVKHPMDLLTIKEKLLAGEYKNPWDFCEDVWLMFENAWLYNRKNSKVYKYCTKLSEVFMEEIDPVMRRLGYCCGRKLAFTPLALVCYGQPMCTIPRDAQYYCYETTSQFGIGVNSERYTYCKKCFEEYPGDSINMSEDPNSNANLISKSNFLLMKNDQIEYESFVECGMCGRKWHQICALYHEQICSKGFVCSNCSGLSSSVKISENRFTAKRLPPCKLAAHIECRVNNYLRKKDSGAGEVIIRVLASSDKEVEVKPLMKAKFCTSGEIPEKFPYRTKAIFAFEVLDGVEICFFGLHVQEYGSNCPQPNSRRVYIAYLDSVHYFQPKQYRTAVYHEILLGYLEYVKLLGYTMAHIWACPPSEGDDYIFHCHPAEQKIPKPKRLQEWYKKMLDKGIVERIVVDYKDIYKHAQDEHLQSATELPYFEGDYWPNVLEDCIKELEAEEAERRREAEAMMAAVDAADEVNEEVDELPNPERKKCMKIQKKKAQKNKSSQMKKSKKVTVGTGNELSDKIYAMMEKHKEVFFVVRLHSAQAAAVLSPINDPDPLISCDLMDGRDSFLSIARERHWEFSSFRRALFSTICLSYELHTQGQDKFVYTCNSCRGSNAVWHCPTCDDFDLCQCCYEKSKHDHKMEQIKSIITDDNPNAGDSGAPNPNSRTESIQRCIQSLVHACQCRDANCRRLSCMKMKRVVQHTKTCKKRHNGTCPVCKQLMALCCFHARTCTEQNCMVPFCLNIRQKLAEQQVQLRKRAQRDMQRRMNAMQHQSTVSVAGTQQSPNMAVPSPSQQVPPAAVRAAMEVERIAASQSYCRTGSIPMTRQMPGNGPMNRHIMPPSPMGWDGSGNAMQRLPGPMPVQRMPIHRHAVPSEGHYGQPAGGEVGMAHPGTSLPVGMQQRMSEAKMKQLHMVIQRFKHAKKGESEAIAREFQNDPQLFSTIINMRHMSNQQYQPQAAGPGGGVPSPSPGGPPRAQWNGPPGYAMTPHPSSQSPMQRPQFYPGGSVQHGMPQQGAPLVQPPYGPAAQQDPTVARHVVPGGGGAVPPQYHQSAQQAMQQRASGNVNNGFPGPGSDRSPQGVYSGNGSSPMAMNPPSGLRQTVGYQPTMQQNLLGQVRSPSPAALVRSPSLQQSVLPPPPPPLAAASHGSHMSQAQVIHGQGAVMHHQSGMMESPPAQDPSAVMDQGKYM